MAEINAIQLTMMQQNSNDFDKLQNERKQIESLLDYQNQTKELIEIDIAHNHSVKVNKSTFMKIPESDLSQLMSGSIPFRKSNLKNLTLNDDAESLLHVVDYLKQVSSQS